MFQHVVADGLALSNQPPGWYFDIHENINTSEEHSDEVVDGGGGVTDSSHHLSWRYSLRV